MSKEQARWRLVVPVQHAVAVCKRCPKILSVGNMSQTAKQHKCKGGTVGVVKRTMEPTFGPIPPEERGTTQPPDVQRAIRRRLGLALVSGQVPFAFVNNVHLQSIFQLLGVDVLKEKHYRTEVLDELYKEVKQATMKELRELVEEGFMIVSDGWKSKFAGCGTPLVNFLVLKPDGGVLFLRVVDVSGKRKDAEAIMDLHLEVVEELRKELAVEKVTSLGFIMDNTAPNLKAMRMLQQHTPTVIAIGCSAHALNLLCKILSKHDKLQALQQHQQCSIVAQTRTDEDGRTVAACISMRRNLWSFEARTFVPYCSEAAGRLLSMHVTTAAAERNWSSWGNTYDAGRAQLGIESAEKMVYIKANIPTSKSPGPSLLLAEGL
ncbi:hypothetical protein QJQ45_011288 [Haematococcus lacustris]|nr:hypothetical protein QJQ45_011288 [Haematococcus lacustris]